MSNATQSTQDTAAQASGLKPVPELVWSPAATAALVLIPGLIGWATGQPWLFPSLGPTAYLQAVEPQQPTSRFYNVVAGHMLGMGAAFLCVWLFGAATEPSVLSHNQVYPGRLWASTAAIALTVLLQLVTRSVHPPAAATVLLITLGGFQMKWSSVLALTTGVVIVGVVGEIVRRARLMQPGQN